MNGETVSANIDASAAGERFGEAIGLVVGEGKLAHRYGQTDVAHVPDGGNAMMRDFVDVESEFSLNVLVLAFRVIHRSTVLGAELWELNGDGEIGGFRVTDRVANVMRKRANGEGKFVGVLRIAEKIDNEIAGADVVGQVGE